MNTAIVGAGMTGLVAALRLAQAGHAVTVYERDAVPGGLVAGFCPVPGGAPLERFYHHVFRSDARAIALVAELGLSARLRWSRPGTMCLYDGKLRRLDSPRSLLAFDALPLASRLRLAFALGVLKLAPVATPFERRYALAWLRAIAGDAAIAAIFEPLFRAKFGEFAEQIALGWFWARIRDRTPELGYLDGGFALLYEALVRRVRELGGSVVFECGVAAIARDGASLAVRLTSAARADASAARHDRVVATVALRRLQSLCAELPAGFAQSHERVAPLAARCLILALERPLTGSYWINVCEPGWPFMVVVEHTALVAPAQYGGRHLVYVGNYGRAFPHVEARELAAQFEPYLRRLNPDYRDAWVCDAWQFVAPDAQPIVSPGYRQRIAPFATGVPNLYVANLSQVYPHDRGQNYAVELAERLVERIR